MSKKPQTQKTPKGHEIPEALMAEIRKAKGDRPLNQIVNEALRLWLAKRDSPFNQGVNEGLLDDAMRRWWATKGKEQFKSQP